MCVSVFGLLCSDAMGHISGGGSSRDKRALIFPVPINLCRGVLCVHKHLCLHLETRLDVDAVVTLVKSTLKPAWQNPCPSGSGSSESHVMKHVTRSSERYLEQMSHVTVQKA